MKPLIENFSDNVEIQVMAKKVNEIVEWIDKVPTFMYRKDKNGNIVDIRILDKDSLGCNTPKKDIFCRGCGDKITIE